MEVAARIYLTHYTLNVILQRPDVIYQKNKIMSQATNLIIFLQRVSSFCNM